MGEPGPLCGPGKFICIEGVPQIVQEIVEIISVTAYNDETQGQLLMDAAKPAPSDTTVRRAVEIYEDQFRTIRKLSIEVAWRLLEMFAQKNSKVILYAEIPDSLGATRNERMQNVANFLRGIPDECTLTLVKLIQIWNFAYSDVRSPEYAVNRLKAAFNSKNFVFFNFLFNNINEPDFCDIIKQNLSYPTDISLPSVRIPNKRYLELTGASSVGSSPTATSQKPAISPQTAPSPPPRTKTTSAASPPPPQHSRSPPATSSTSSNSRPATKSIFSRLVYWLKPCTYGFRCK